MTVQRTTSTQFPAISRVLEQIAYLLPALVLAYPVLVWPIVYPSIVDELNGLVAPPTVVPEYALNKVYFPALFILSLLSALTSKRQIPRQMYAFIAVLGAILVYFAMSAFWSLAPAITLRRLALEAIVCLTMVLAAISVSRPQKILSNVVWLMVVAMAINLLAVLVFPTGKIGHPGIYNHKNTLGATACLAILVCMYGVAARGSTTLRIASILTILVSLFELQQSRSKTALGLTFLAPAIGLYLYTICRFFRIPLIHAMTGTTIAFALVCIMLSETFGIRASDIFLWLFNDETFSGRTLIWQFTLEHIQERPWLGYGYAGFWDIGADSPKFQMQNFIARMPHAHNGFLEIVLETGLVGFTLLLAFLMVVTMGIGCVFTKDNTAFLCFTTMLVYILLNELMEHDIFLPMPPNWNFLILIAAVSSAICRDSEDIQKFRSRQLQG